MKNNKDMEIFRNKLLENVEFLNIVSKYDSDIIEEFKLNENKKPTEKLETSLFIQDTKQGGEILKAIPEEKIEDLMSFLRLKIDKTTHKWKIFTSTLGVASTLAFATATGFGIASLLLGGTNLFIGWITGLGLAVTIGSLGIVQVAADDSRQFTITEFNHEIGKLNKSKIKNRQEELIKIFKQKDTEKVSINEKQMNNNLISEKERDKITSF